MRAADAAAQLVQLRQAQAVGVVDHDGVGGGHVDAALDDRRAQQHVEAPVVEIHHQLLEVALAHLAMADADRWPPERCRRRSSAIFSMVWISLCTK